MCELPAVAVHALQLSDEVPDRSFVCTDEYTSLGTGKVTAMVRLTWHFPLVVLFGGFVGLAPRSGPLSISAAYGQDAINRDSLMHDDRDGLPTGCRHRPDQ